MKYQLEYFQNGSAFRAPNKGNKPLLGAGLAHFEVFFHAVTSRMEVDGLRGKFDINKMKKDLKDQE